MFLFDHRRLHLSTSSSCLGCLLLLDETLLPLDQLLMLEEHVVGVLEVAEEHFIAVLEITEELFLVLVLVCLQLTLGWELITTLLINVN